MATGIQRLTMVVEGFLNRTPTTAEVWRLADAIGDKTLGGGYTELTNNQKALHAVRYLRQHVVEMRKSVDSEADVAAAKDASSKKVDAEFAET